MFARAAKTLGLLLCLFLALPIGARNPHGFAAGFTTGFPSTENPISQGGIWTNGSVNGVNTAVQTTSGLAFATQVPGSAPPFTDSAAALSGFHANQWAQGTVHNSSANLREVELLLHVTFASGLSQAYEVDITTNFGLGIVRWDGTPGTFTILTSGISDGACTANGAVDRAQIVAGVITVICAGTQIAQVTDMTYATGNPGIGFYADTNNGAPSANNTFGWSSFQAGNL